MLPLFHYCGLLLNTKFTAQTTIDNVTMINPKIPQSCKCHSCSRAQIIKEMLNNRLIPRTNGVEPLPLKAIKAIPKKIKMKTKGSSQFEFC